MRAGYKRLASGYPDVVATVIFFLALIVIAVIGGEMVRIFASRSLLADRKSATPPVTIIPAEVHSGALDPR